MCGGLLLAFLGVASLSLRLITLTTQGQLASWWVRVLRGAGIVTPVVLVWVFSGAMSPLAVLGVLAVLTLGLCWQQQAHQRMIERWVAAGRPARGELR